MSARIIRENLLAIVAAYCHATGKSLTQASKEFYGNATFFRDLKSPKRDDWPSIGADKLETMLASIRAKWPEDARWPATRPVFMGRNPQE
jgi:hypothetical protein